MPEPTELLRQEALSRMIPYELVEQAVREQADEHNALGIEPVETEDGYTLHTVTSGLFADSPRIFDRLLAEDDELVHRQTLTDPLTLLAHVVALRQSTDEAVLYSVQDTFTPTLAETRRPFYTTATQALAEPGVYSGIVQFNRRSNGRQPELNEPGIAYFSQGQLNVRSGESTTIHLERIGVDELEREVGVLATVSGPIHIKVGDRHYMRITDRGAFYAPRHGYDAAITLPEGTPQQHDSIYYRIPR